jgi:hypothetical protein
VNVFGAVGSSAVHAEFLEMKNQQEGFFNIVGLPEMFGRWDATPVFAVSVLIVAVNGRPDCTVVTPEICQLPMKAFAHVGTLPRKA